MVARPLTIVQMLPELITGGVERGTLEIGAYLVKNGHRSIVVSNGGPMVKDLVDNGSEHITLPVGSKNPRSLMCILKLRKLFIEEKVDIIHLRSRMPAWIGFLAAKTIPFKKRPRIVTTFHGVYSINKYSAIMTKGDGIIAISHFIKDHLKEVYGVPDDRVKLIFRGFDSARFHPDKVSQEKIENFKKEWGLTNFMEPIIIFPARFSKWKGHSLLLDALEKIKHLQWKSVFVGDFNENFKYYSLIKRKAQNNKIADRVIFTGLCTDMPAALKSCDIAVSASLSPEAFGRVAVEAQAMGLPVIATAHGGSLETVKDLKTGWLCEPDNSTAMGNALNEAVTNAKKRSKMGTDAITWVTGNFNTQIMCHKTVELYKELLSNSPLGNR